MHGLLSIAVQYAKAMGLSEEWDIDDRWKYVESLVIVYREFSRRRLKCDDATADLNFQKLLFNLIS